jgi:hypothetical protein
MEGAVRNRCVDADASRRERQMTPVALDGVRVVGLRVEVEELTHRVETYRPVRAGGELLARTVGR